MEQEDAEEIEEYPEDGVYIHGFFMDGARWNREEACVDDPLPGELYSTMPVIHFKPQADYKRNEEEY